MDIWLAWIVTIITAIVGGLIGLWLSHINNPRQPVMGVDNRAVGDRHDAELEEMKKRIAALEAKLQRMKSRPM
ncbi:MAG: hypothetical protein ONB44_20975 [candidate division KSB1 bacterium]|nr:hypothetical protein [candidate division KSB1 bacterium]MDZ7304607.1 hypothetical protein [candidate division KSB1 bacterium]MDZ7313740.1 hypothetical protein [candidate division KSB1 bacterium]